jgi:lipoyl-dependent peroxiredoxin
MALTRRAGATWQGNLASGGGSVSAESGVFSGAAIDWRNRAEGNEGKTSPEELLAASHAACYAMAFSHGLSEAGHEPEQVSVSAEATFDLEGGPHVSGIKLTVNASVPGIEDGEFQTIANGAKDGCPISAALAGNVPIELEATLQ